MCIGTQQSCTTVDHLPSFRIDIHTPNRGESRSSLTLTLSKWSAGEPDSRTGLLEHIYNRSKK